MVTKVSGSDVTFGDGDKITDVVGTVSQSAGLPTGSIFEKGSNSNGDYVKFADGTLICTKRVSANAAIPAGQGISGTVDNTNVAAAFVNTPVVTVQATFYMSAGQAGEPLYGLSFYWNMNSYSILNTGQKPTGQWPAFAMGTNAAASYTFTVIAIGRWY